VLLTKLQIVELNDKDVRDVVALLLDHPFGATGGEGMELPRIVDVTSKDWGLEHTMRSTLARVKEMADDYGLEPPRVAAVRRRADALLKAMDGSTKSLAWRMRARVGERVKWYQTPEEARR
jgi:hypothetical protein